VADAPVALDLWLSAEDYALLLARARCEECSAEAYLVRMVKRLGAPGAPTVVCAGCGVTYAPERKPVPGRRAWCDGCRSAGLDSRARQEAYRLRRRARFNPNGALR